MMNMFGRDFIPNGSPLQHLINKAIDPYMFEPNYAAHLEVAEYINNKKANTPREASMTVVRMVNNRNPHIAVLALALLETLVQSCGYPFHLQISTKEFLNELVRRFPERPPPFPGPVMSKILNLIHTWKETICVDSRWKEDLGNIRDMHRLLMFKGYRFRDAGNRQQQQTVAVASTSNLKSADELEEEDREAQSAKLQELIRRGTPRDLAAAQELMKSLAGAEPEKKPDYRSQSITELNKLEQKVILLNEMLDNVDTQRGEKFVSGDVYDQVASILTSARPKIQKWISDAESNDPEMLDIFLQMNDQMNSVLNRYESFKKGDFVAAANPVPSELAGSSKTNDLSLIDFDDSAASSATSGGTADDLAGLFGSSSNTSSPPNTNPAPTQSFGQNFLASIAQAQSYNGQQQQSQSSFSTTGMYGSNAQAANAIYGNTTSTSPPSSSPFGAIMLPATPGPGSPTISPSTATGQSSQINLGGGQRQNGGSAILPTPMPVPMQSTSQSQPQSQLQNQNKAKDPFADLVGLF